MPRSNSFGVLEGLSLRHLHLIPDYVRLVEPMPVAAHRVRDLFETWCLSPSSMPDVMLSLGSLEVLRCRCLFLGWCLWNVLHARSGSAHPN